MTEVIAASHLSKWYGAVQAVVDVSFSVAAGEVVCLLGPNGAGKSTTTRILTTLTRADGGSATVAGYDVATQPRSVRASIGYIAQHAGTDAYLTGRENLMVQAAAQRLRRGQPTRRRIEELLDLVGLGDAADRRVGTYSGGMRRRLEIVMGIIHNPTVIFLDEPTTGLDPEARANLWDKLTNLANQQTVSILLTTHYLDEADQLADRIVIIDQGTIITQGTPNALKAELAGDSVTIELAGRPSAKTVSAVADRLGSRSVGIDGTLLHVHVRDGNQAMPVILAELQAAGLDVASAQVSRPSLDEVYLHHTGRTFNANHQPPKQAAIAR